MTTPRDHLIHWLRDAYAMETHALEMCQRQVERIKNYPELTERISQHVSETKDQISKLEECFRILDTNSSVFRNALGWTAGNMQAMSGMLASDEIVQGSMSSYVFEHMEISTYKVLIAAAEAANEPRIAELCASILEQEQAMADWLEEHLAATTSKFLERDMTDQPARV